MGCRLAASAGTAIPAPRDSPDCPAGMAATRLVLALAGSHWHSVPSIIGNGSMDTNCGEPVGLRAERKARPDGSERVAPPPVINHPATPKRRAKIQTEFPLTIVVLRWAILSPSLFQERSISHPG